MDGIWLFLALTVALVVLALVGLQRLSGRDLEVVAVWSLEASYTKWPIESSSVT